MTLPGILKDDFLATKHIIIVKLFVNNLTTVDFSYVDRHRGIVGESWQTSIVLHGQLNAQGMVCDFSHVKKYSKHWLDNTLDHSLAIPVKMPSMEIENLSCGSLLLSWHDSKNRQYFCKGPECAFTLLETDCINATMTAEWAAQHLKGQFPDALDTVDITFTPEVIDGAYYHYSHGLKKHEGNCQRIAHGHRSKIQIFKNHQRATQLESLWAKTWEDIYIASIEDKSNEEIVNNQQYFIWEYHASQGHFKLMIPADKCYLFSGDSTVENIAQHIAIEIKQLHPNDHISVYAYEGIGKGAIVSIK